MTRVTFLLLMPPLVVGTDGIPSAQEPGHPNVIFIAIDDLNNWVGVLGGHPQTRPPNIDRLADRGMVFTNAHAVSASCNPSRTALLTGLRPSSTGVYTNGQDWRSVERLQGIPTLPQTLSR